MSKIKTHVYASVCKDSLWDEGKKLGLEGESLSHFSHFGGEIKINIEVEPDGLVNIIGVFDVPLKTIKVPSDENNIGPF